MLHLNRYFAALVALLCVAVWTPASHADDLLGDQHTFLIEPLPAVVYMGLDLSASMDTMMDVTTNGYMELYNYLMAEEITPAGPPFAIWNVADPNAAVWDYTIAVPVEAVGAGNDRIKPGSLAATYAATTTFTGPYEALGAIYPSMYEWVTAQGRAPGGASREVYVVSPGDTDDSNQWQTIVQIPLAPAEGEMMMEEPMVEIEIGEPMPMPEPVHNYHITVKKSEPIHYAGIMMTATMDQLMEAFPAGLSELSMYLASNQIGHKGMPFTIWHDVEMDAAAWRFELCIPVDQARDVPASGNIRGTVLPGVKVASIVYVGPYEGLEGAYGWFYNKLAESGYVVNGAPRDFYLNDPGEVSPAEYQTEIQVPVM